MPNLKPFRRHLAKLFEVVVSPSKKKGRQFRYNFCPVYFVSPRLTAPGSPRMTATRFKSGMMIRLLSGFTRRAGGNLAKLCIISMQVVNRQMSHSVFSSFCSSLFFLTSHNTKREVRDFRALNRHKNTAGGRESGKNIVHPVFVFMQIKVAKSSIIKSTFFSQSGKKNRS